MKGQEQDGSGTLARVPTSTRRHPAVLAERARRISVWECHCAKCGHTWTSTGEDIPEACAGCRMINWWIKRPRGRPPKVAPARGGA